MMGLDTDLQVPGGIFETVLRKTPLYQEALEQELRELSQYFFRDWVKPSPQKRGSVSGKVLIYFISAQSGEGTVLSNSSVCRECPLFLKEVGLMA